MGCAIGIRCGDLVKLKWGHLLDKDGNFKKQMLLMLLWIAVYATVYAIFINPLYGIIQMGVALTIPLLKMYNGQRGSFKGMKYFFYLYYPIHLVICGIIRILINGNIGVMIGG